MLLTRIEPTDPFAVTVKTAGVYLPGVPSGYVKVVDNGVPNTFRIPTLLQTPSEVIILEALKAVPLGTILLFCPKVSKNSVMSKIPVVRTRSLVRVMLLSITPPAILFNSTCPNVPVPDNRCNELPFKIIPLVLFVLVNVALFTILPFRFTRNVKHSNVPFPNERSWKTVISLLKVSLVTGLTFKS